MGSAYRAVTDPSVRFTYAVNPFMVGNLADTPFDGQSAILARGRRGKLDATTSATGRSWPGRICRGIDRMPVASRSSSPWAPWVVPDSSRARLRAIGAALASGTDRYRYVQTAAIADLPFPADASQAGAAWWRADDPRISRREALDRSGRGDSRSALHGVRRGAGRGDEVGAHHRGAWMLSWWAPGSPASAPRAISGEPATRSSCWRREIGSVGARSTTRWGTAKWSRSAANGWVPGRTGSLPGPDRSVSRRSRPTPRASSCWSTAAS